MLLRLRTPPPPFSAQKVLLVAESNSTTLPPPPAIPARTVASAGQGPNDQDVDITSPDSDGPEEDEPAIQTDREPQWDEIIKQLEKGILDWPGFGEEGRKVG
jgi:hypothetical protein